MLRLEQVSSGDEPFLYELYAETRREELSVLDWDDTQRHAFLRMQFDAQRRSYRAQYADLQQRIVYRGSDRVGQISTAATAEAIVLVDVCLHPGSRNQGVGSYLITDLQEQARSQGKGMRLHVFQQNPAQRLYARLGFRVAGEQFPYLSMVWSKGDS